MTRPIPATLLAHLKGDAVTRADCVMLKSRDGSRVGFTTCDVAMTADLGEGDETYAQSMTISQLVLAAGLDGSFFEMSGPLGPVITRVNVGRWKDAEAWLFRMSPKVPGEIAPMIYGRVREPRIEGARFVFEVRGEQDRLNQTVGGVLSPYCDVRDYGGDRCFKEVETTTAIVTAVSDDMRFTLAYEGTFADGFFAPGTAQFTSGPLAGTWPFAIHVWTADGAGNAAVEMVEPMIEAPTVGDEITIRRDCPRTRAACMERDNILWFQGEPDLFGSDELMRAQIPGSSDA